MNKLRIIGIIVIVVGIGLMFVPKSEPKYECAEPGAPYSGAVAGDCNLTDEDYKKYVDYESSANPFALLGLGVAVLGVVGVAASFKKKK